MLSFFTMILRFRQIFLRQVKIKKNTQKANPRNTNSWKKIQKSNKNSGKKPTKARLWKHNLAWISDGAPDSVAFLQEQFDHPRSDEATGAGDADGLAGDWRHVEIFWRGLWFGGFGESKETSLLV